MQNTFDIEVNLTIYSVICVLFKFCLNGFHTTFRLEGFVLKFCCRAQLMLDSKIFHFFYQNLDFLHQVPTSGTVSAARFLKLIHLVATVSIAQPNATLMILFFLEDKPTLVSKLIIDGTNACSGMSSKQNSPKTNRNYVFTSIQIDSKRNFENQRLILMFIILKVVHLIN